MHGRCYGIGIHWISGLGFEGKTLRLESFPLLMRYHVHCSQKCRTVVHTKPICPTSFRTAVTGGLGLRPVRAGRLARACFRKGQGDAASSDTAKDLAPPPRSGTVKVKRARAQQQPASDDSNGTSHWPSTSVAAPPARSAHSSKHRGNSKPATGARHAPASNQQAAKGAAKRPWQWVRDAPLLTNDIKTAAGLQQLQPILSRHIHALNGVHASLLLARCVEFAEQDPVRWYYPDPRAVRKAAGRTQLQATTAALASLWEDGTASDTDDWGMSDTDAVEQTTTPAARRARAAPRHLTQTQQNAALQELGQVVMATASVAARAAKHGDMDATAASCTISSLAKLGYSDKRVLATVLSACQATLVDSSSRALTNTLWACTMLKWKPQPSLIAAAEAALMKQLPRLNSMQLSTCVYALGGMGHRPMPAIMQAVCERARTLLPACRPAELANLAAGLAGMRHLPDDSWTGAYLQATTPRLRSYQLSDLHRTLIALSALNCKPSEAWLNEFYSACRSALVDEAPGNILTVRMMASMSFSLSRLGCRPDIRWMDVCLMRSRPSLEASPAADLTQLVCSLAMLRYRPGDTWLQAFLMAAFQRLDSFTPSQTVSMLQALARLGHLPPSMFLDELASKLQPRLSQFGGEQLADVVAAMARLHYRPTPEWLVTFESTSQGKLVDVSAGGLTSMVWALAQMGHQPAVSWLYSFVLAAYGRLDAFDAGQLGVVFDALPRVSPTPTWLDELVQICASETNMRSRSVGSSSYDGYEMEAGQDGDVGEAGPVPAPALNGSSLAGAALGINGSEDGIGAPINDNGGSNGSSVPGGIWFSNGASNDQATSLRVYGLHGAGADVEAVPLNGCKVRVRNGSTRTPSAAAPVLSASAKERVVVPMAMPAPRSNQHM